MQQKENPTPSVEDIKEKFGQIDRLVDQANVKLVQVYRQKQQEVVHRYQEDIHQAKEQLQQLKRVNNDQELAKRVARRKDDLQLERKKYLQSATEYAQKCKIYKEKLAKAISDTQDMEKQVTFLKNQITKAEQKNYRLKKEKASLKLKQVDTTSPVNETTAIHQESECDNTKSIQVTHPPKKPTRWRQDIKDMKAKLQIERKVQDRLNMMLKDKRLQESQFEKIFIEVVEKVKRRKMQSDKQKGKLPPLGKITDQELNDFDKRQILEQFLSNEKIKFYFYRLIFNEAIGKANPKA